MDAAMVISEQNPRKKTHGASGGFIYSKISGRQKIFSVVLIFHQPFFGTERSPDTTKMHGYDILRVVSTALQVPVLLEQLFEQQAE